MLTLTAATTTMPRATTMPPAAGSEFRCVVTAAIGGFLSAISINILAYAAHLERQNEHRRRIRWALPVNLVMGVVAQLVFVNATNQGPVALAMPVQTAAQLMLNMLIQVGLQMKEFTKGMRVGTMTIVCAIVCLIDVGPTDTHIPSVMKLLENPKAIGFLSFNSFVTLLGIFIIWCNPRNCRNNLADGTHSMRSPLREDSATSTSSFITMVGYAAAQASTIVFTTSIGKLLGDFNGPKNAVPLIACALIWLLISAFNVIIASLAARRCDASFYVPLFAGSKLLLNAAAGLFVWNDNLEGHVSAYIMVYCLIIMGVYLLSSIDVAGMVALRRLRAGAGGTTNFQTSAMGEVTQDLLSLWRMVPLSGERNEEYASHVVRNFLNEGLDSDAWNDKALLELCMALMRGKCSSGDPQLLSWIKWNLQSEPKLVQELVALRPTEDPESGLRKNSMLRSLVDGAMDVALERGRGLSDAASLRSTANHFGSDRSSFAGARPENVAEALPAAVPAVLRPGDMSTRSAGKNRSWETTRSVDVEVATRPRGHSLSGE